MNENEHANNCCEKRQFYYVIKGIIVNNYPWHMKERYSAGIVNLVLENVIRLDRFHVYIVLKEWGIARQLKGKQ